MSLTNASSLLPAGVGDLLPPEARLEAHVLRRFAELVAVHGFDPVKPPLVEFEETLLHGSGESIARQTFRLMDPLSQRMMALRADITPQIARIAGSRLGNLPRPLRLSYTGDVLRISGEDQLRPERQFCQTGCELIGSDSVAADAEMMLLAVACLKGLGIDGISVDITLPGLVPALLKSFGFPPPLADELAGAIERRDLTRVRKLGPNVADIVETLIAASGPIEPAMDIFAAAGLPDVLAPDLQRLCETLRLIRRESPELVVTVDPTERRGFEYQYALSFTLFVRVVGEVGRGGRYRTHVGPVSEPAIGFTLLTENLLRAVPSLPAVQKVYLPPGVPLAAAAGLHGQGFATVRGLTEVDPASEAIRLGCTHLWNGTLQTIEAR